MFLAAKYLLKYYLRSIRQLRTILAVGGFLSPDLPYVTALYATFYAKDSMVDAGISKV